MVLTFQLFCEVLNNALFWCVVRALCAMLAGFACAVAGGCQSLMKSSLIAVCKHDFSVPEKEKTRAYQLCVLDICILIYKRICARILESRKSPASGISLLRSNLRVQGHGGSEARPVAR